jgi:4,4'-diaponeurosporenoate glycosyltransferase
MGIVIHRAISFILYLIGWFLGFYKLCMNRSISKEALTEKPPHRKVSIIIPARNEEKSLANLLQSLSKQTVKPYEVIVVDDFSEDKTAGIAHTYQARVITPSKMPSGWTGKNWACHTGYREASGDVLLFLDADVVLDERGLELLLGALISHGGLVSVQPYHYMKRAYEQMSLFFNLIAVMSVNAFGANRKGRKSFGAFGPCMMIDRDTYELVNGHQAVKDKIVEDMVMGELLKKNDIPVSLFNGGSIIKFRMYPGGIKEVVEGWTKNFMLGAKMLPFRMLFPVFLWVFGSIGAIDLLITNITGSGSIWVIGIGIAVYLMFAGQIYFLSRRIGGFWVITSLLYPIALLFFMFVFFRSVFFNLVLKKVRWKDREIESS